MAYKRIGSSQPNSNGSVSFVPRPEVDLYLRRLALRSGTSLGEVVNQAVERAVRDRTDGELAAAIRYLVRFGSSLPEGDLKGRVTRLVAELKAVSGEWLNS